MPLGIQKLNGNSGPADLPLPPYTLSGMEKPANMIGRCPLPAWPADDGGLTLGPGRSGSAITQSGSGNGRFTGLWGALRISFWIRTSQNRGGAILAFAPAVTGSGSGPNPAGTDTFGISVGADGISAGGAECLFDLNEFNSGWHHVFFAFNTDSTVHDLYVDGRPKTWTTPSSGSAFTSGFDALHIGGVIENFKQGVTDYNTNFSWSGGTQQFDIAQLAVYEGGAVSDFYPLYDLGSTGKAPGTFTRLVVNTTGGAHPYPIIYIPFNWSDFNPVLGWGLSSATSGPYDFTTGGTSEANIFNHSSQITWYDLTGKTSGVVGNGPISSGERLPPVKSVPYGSPAEFTYNANRELYYNIPLGGSMNFWAYDDLSQDWIINSAVYLNANDATIRTPTDDYRTMLFKRDHNTGKILWNIFNEGGPGIPNNDYNFEFNYTPSAGWNHYSFLFSSQDTDIRTKTVQLYVNGVLERTVSQFDTDGTFTIFTIGENIGFDGVSFQQLYIKRSGRIDTRGRYVEFGGTAVTDTDPGVLAATNDLYERFTPTLTNLVEPNATAS